MTEDKNKAVIADKEWREALACAHAALSEIARTRGLDPKGEHARDLCADVLEKLGGGDRPA